MEDFRNVLADLEPTHILVLGMNLWSHLEADEERGEDIVIGNAKAATFTYDFDILTLVKSKEFAPIMKAAMKSQSGGAAVCHVDVAEAAGPVLHR